MPDRDPAPNHPGTPPIPLAHETRNREQHDEDAQAHDVAEAARRPGSAATSPLESVKPETNDNDVAPDSTGDLIDEMRRMEGAGQIDMSAFAGEPNHDDEPGAYGGETTDDEDPAAGADWLIADGEEVAEETDLLDDAGLLEEAELRDDDDIIRTGLPDDEED